jgi:hypothetical protein
MNMGISLTHSIMIVTSLKKMIATDERKSNDMKLGPGIILTFTEVVYTDHQGSCSDFAQ